MVSIENTGFSPYYTRSKRQVVPALRSSLWFSALAEEMSPGGICLNAQGSFGTTSIMPSLSGWIIIIWLLAAKSISYVALPRSHRLA